MKEEISYFTEMFYDLPFTKPFLQKILDFSDETFLNIATRRTIFKRQNQEK
jgi:hypothetical protein